MIPKAERPFRLTHPIDFFLFFFFVPTAPPLPPPFILRTTKMLLSSPPRRHVERDAFSSTHDFIQLISKAKNPLPSHSTKPETKKGAVKQKKNEEGEKKQKKHTHIWPYRESKRHQPHTSGQCSFHSAYIQALLWIKKKKKKKQTNQQIVWTFARECRCVKGAVREKGGAD